MRRFVEERALCSGWWSTSRRACGSARSGRPRRTAAQAAALLATAAVQNGDRAGLILVSDRIEVELAPAGGVRHLSQLVRGGDADHLAQDQAECRPGAGAPDGPARDGRGHQRFHQRGAGRDLATARCGRHDTIALWVVDPREDQLPDAGLLAHEDAEPRGRADR